ncbi:type 11 methyltransferase like protein [Zymoseptoria brevis]|uniref:Type 11 methyltransferase like protein n=1 Tax=Zymoseptoria brevis TaxID=1047168 RepID=A0A0F4G8Y1_9PEZI|nr:type 11 methyltransferase like protein [Zymoseptoria brevis]
MPVTTNTGGNSFLERVYNVSDPEELKHLYDEWADTYDSGVLDPTQDYVAPTFVAQAVVASYGSIENAKILDAGCGTGLSGLPLHKAGARNIDGVDLSEGMLKVARKLGIYSDLATADLSKPIEKPDGSYDIVVCVGTLTHGHVGPRPALEEMARITKKGGVVVSTILDDIWEEHGFAAEVDRLKSEGLVEVVSNESKDYRPGAKVTAKILVLRRK